MMKQLGIYQKDKKSINIQESYEVKYIQKLVLSIFHPALGEFEFLSYYKSQLKILWRVNRK